jgi:hypothetical protein
MPVLTYTSEYGTTAIAEIGREYPKYRPQFAFKILGYWFTFFVKTRLNM